MDKTKPTPTAKIELSPEAKANIERLLKMLDEREKDLKTFYDSTIKLLEVIGLAKDGKLIEEITSENGNFMSPVMKAIGDISVLLAGANLPKFAGGERNTKKLQEKFAFFSEAAPLLEKYANRYKK
jgi:hypothetical protein